MNFSNILFQLHAVYHKKQGEQREPSVKTLRSPLSVKFQRLSGRDGYLAIRPPFVHFVFIIFYVYIYYGITNKVIIIIRLIPKSPAPRLALATTEEMRWLSGEQTVLILGSLFPTLLCAGYSVKLKKKL